MLITNKKDLLDNLKLVVNKKCIYMQVLNYTLFLYSYSDYYYLRSRSEQSILHPIDNILKLDITSENIKILKKYLNLKSSRIEIRDKYIYLTKYKQTKKDLIPELIEGSEVVITLEVVDRLPYKLPISEFNYENIDNYEDVCIFPNKVDTKFEFDSYKISDSIYINSKVLPIIHKVFSDSYVDIEYNLENNICRLSNNDAGNYLYIKCLDRIS